MNECVTTLTTFWTQNWDLLRNKHSCCGSRRYSSVIFSTCSFGLLHKKEVGKKKKVIGSLVMNLWAWLPIGVNECMNTCACVSIGCSVILNRDKDDWMMMLLLLSWEQNCFHHTKPVTFPGLDLKWYNVDAGTKSIFVAAEKHLVVDCGVRCKIFENMCKFRD